VEYGDSQGYKADGMELLDSLSRLSFRLTPTWLYSSPRLLCDRVSCCQFTYNFRPDFAAVRSLIRFIPF